MCLYSLGVIFIVGVTNNNTVLSIADNWKSGRPTDRLQLIQIYLEKSMPAVNLLYTLRNNDSGTLTRMMCSIWTGRTEFPISLFELLTGPLKSDFPAWPTPTSKPKIDALYINSVKAIVCYSCLVYVSKTAVNTTPSNFYLWTLWASIANND